MIVIELLKKEIKMKVAIIISLSVIFSAGLFDVFINLIDGERYIIFNNLRIKLRYFRMILYLSRKNRLIG